MMKQVIVMRTDLNMRKGKMIAQGAHAAMIFLLEAGYLNAEQADWAYGSGKTWLKDWEYGRMTKVCVRIDSEQGLRNIMAAAYAADLTCHEVVDAGLTEFHGVPTLTCCAIGPNKTEEIDKITGHLKLL